MKKTTFSCLLILIAVFAFAQRPTNGNAFRAATLASPSQIPSAVGIPTIYTNEVAFLAAVGSTYCIQEFDTLKNGRYVNPTYTVDSSGYRYDIQAKGGLYSCDSSMSTAIQTDTLYLVNQAAKINYFGGYFFATNEAGHYVNDTVKIIVGGYAYTHVCIDSTQFLGFVFPDSIPWFGLSTTSDSIPLYPTVDHLFVGYYEDTAPPTQVLHIANEPKFSVSPNPVSTQFYISGLVGSAMLTLSDFGGNTLLSKSISGNELVNISNFPKGVYILQVESSDGDFSQKLIKE